MKSNPLSLLLLAFFIVLLPNYLLAVDECSGSDYSYTLSSANPTETQTITMSSGQSISYYIQSSTAGTLTITTDNSNNKIHLNGSASSCPAGIASGLTSLVYTEASAFDTNVVVYASNGATHTLTITFTPFDSSSKGHSTQYENPFSIVYGGAGTNIYGDYASIASSVQCIDNAGSCNYNYTGALYNATTKYENSVSTAVIPVNSSTETLSLPADIDGADILYAGLYWQGNITGSDSNNYIAGVNGRDIVTLQDAAGTVHTLTSDKLWHHDFWGNGTGSDGGYRSFYQGYKDITSIIQNSYVMGNINNYTVGNIKSTIGSDYGTYFWGDNTYEYNGIRIGFWGNWNLIVVYRHANVGSLSPQPKPKNITLFQGFDALIPLGSNTEKSVTLPLNGFLTPSTTPIEAKLLFYGAGAEKVLAYDTFKIQDGKTTNYISLSNALNPVDDAFNGSVSSFGVPINASIGYYPGLDSDEFDISFAMDTKQTTTSLSLTAKNVGGTGDQIFPGLIAFSTDIYEPGFCYDYAYKQQGVYFTEDNDGTQNPKITGNDVVIGEPVTVSIFLRNLVDSDILVSNMSVDILDINTTQSDYITNSTKLAKIGALTPTNLVDVIGDGTNPANVSIGTASGGDFIKDVTIGTIGSNDHFYIYYDLDPKSTSMNMPLIVQANYDLIIGGSTIPYSLNISDQIPMCSGSSNLDYSPGIGRFNVVHNDYYTYDPISNPSGTKYYNLPTQITRREGNFKVIATDPDNLDQLQEQSVSVAVEMIDASAYHDTYTSCQEEDSAISEKVQVFFDTNVTSVPFDKAAIQKAIDEATTDLTNTSDFYKTAKENVAFRVSYGLTNDGNDGLVQHSYDPSTDEYNILNFTQLVQDIGTCVQTVTYNLTPVQTSDNVAVACGNAAQQAAPLTRKHYYACLQCLYGINTRFDCSRDNFSIRPEAFMFKIDDQNQTNSTSKLRIADDVSGVTTTPSTTPTQLAAGYQYSLEINATNHLNNDASFGYTRVFSDVSTTDLAEYQWSPTGTPTGCNDVNSSRITFKIVDGDIDLNSSLNQVGEYRLHMEDTTWTTVDNNPAYMAHHDGNPTYFLPSTTPDCIANDSTTQAVRLNADSTAYVKNGCNISSNHDSSGSSLKYRDYNVEFHPYKFEMAGIVPSHGENNNTDFNATTFIYMTDMEKEEEMSFHLNGNIDARGFNNSVMSNFVDNCYAKPVTLTVNKSLAVSAAVDYKYNFQNTDPAIVDKNGSMNVLAGLINLATNDFNKTNNGTINTTLNLNFDRNTSGVLNPEELTFTTYDANCTNPTADCTMFADLSSTKKTDGHRDLNQTAPNNNTRITLKHYYGRAHASRQRYEVPTDNPYRANIYYEVYCFGTIGGNPCQKTLLQQGFASKRSDDVRWFINENHTVNEGSAGTPVEKDALGNVTGIATLGSFPDFSNLTYAHTSGTNSYPYKTTMDHNASRWLIYNESNPTATRNQFAVEFDTVGTGWSGARETTTTTRDPGTAKVNRRSMW